MTIRRLVANAGFRQGLSLLTIAAPIMFSMQAFAQSKQTSESVKYDNWSVSCQEVAGKKACVATLRLIGPDSQQPLAAWQIGLDKDGRLVSVIQVVPGFTIKSKDNKVSTGLQIKNGVDLKLGSATERHLDYVTCNTQICEATGTPIDETFVKEAAGATTSTVTIFTSNGTAVPLTFPSTGLNKALAAVASKKL